MDYTLHRSMFELSSLVVFSSFWCVLVTDQHYRRVSMCVSCVCVCVCVWGGGVFVCWLTNAFTPPSLDCPRFLTPLLSWPTTAALPLTPHH